MEIKIKQPFLKKESSILFLFYQSNTDYYKILAENLEDISLLKVKVIGEFIGTTE